MAITTVDDIASALAVSQKISHWKVFATAKAAGCVQSAWLAAGYPNVAGSAPPAYTAGSGYACDKSTTGALPLSNGAVQNWIMRSYLSSTQTGTIIIFDRLWSCGGMGFGASTYTITTPGSLPARITDNGAGCELWCEIFVAGVGTVTGNLVATYVNPAGTTSRTATIVGPQSGPVQGQLQQFPLQAGDGGIKQLTSVQNTATWTSATYGVSILKRVMEIPFTVANAGVLMDWAGCGLAPVAADACLMFAYQASGAVAPIIFGTLSIGDK